MTASACIALNHLTFYAVKDIMHKTIKYFHRRTVHRSVGGVSFHGRLSDKMSSELGLLLYVRPSFYFLEGDAL